jgi:hypothetical protein
MLAAGRIFSTVEEARKKLQESHGSDYAVVAVPSLLGVMIYDEPQLRNHPVGEDILESNLKGARMLHGKKRPILIRAMVP